MGPKRRSTEGAGSSSSSLLHKVARTPGRKCVRLGSQSKQIVENVRAFFEKENACKLTINRMAVVKRTTEATGLSEITIRDIHKGNVARDGQLLTPVKRYTTSRIQINPDTFDSDGGVFPSTSEGNTPPSLQCLRRPKRSAAFQTADSASGKY